MEEKSKTSNNINIIKLYNLENVDFVSKKRKINR